MYEFKIVEMKFNWNKKFLVICEIRKLRAFPLESKLFLCLQIYGFRTQDLFCKVKLWKKIDESKFSGV